MLKINNLSTPAYLSKKKKNGLSAVKYCINFLFILNEAFTPH